MTAPPRTPPRRPTRQHPPLHQARRRPRMPTRRGKFAAPNRIRPRGPALPDAAATPTSQRQVGRRRDQCPRPSRGTDFSGPKSMARRCHPPNTKPEQTEKAAAPLRPRGATGCSHGWSGGRALTPAAQPVEGMDSRKPAPPGRRKFPPTDTHRHPPTTHPHPSPLACSSAAAREGPCGRRANARPLRHLTRHGQDHPSRRSSVPSALIAACARRTGLHRRGGSGPRTSCTTRPDPPHPQHVSQGA